MAKTFSVTASAHYYTFDKILDCNVTRCDDFAMFDIGSFTETMNAIEKLTRFVTKHSNNVPTVRLYTMVNAERILSVVINTYNAEPDTVVADVEWSYDGESGQTDRLSIKNAVKNAFETMIHKYEEVSE